MLSIHTGNDAGQPDNQFMFILLFSSANLAPGNYSLSLSNFIPLALVYVRHNTKHTNISSPKLLQKAIIDETQAEGLQGGVV